MFFQIFLAAVSLFLLYLIYKIVNQFLFRKKFFQLLQKSKTKNFTILPSNFGIGQIGEFLNLSENSYKHWSQESFKGNDTAVVFSFRWLRYAVSDKINCRFKYA